MFSWMLLADDMDFLFYFPPKKLDNSFQTNFFKVLLFKDMKILLLQAIIKQ